MRPVGSTVEGSSAACFMYASVGAGGGSMILRSLLLPVGAVVGCFLYDLYRFIFRERS